MLLKYISFFLVSLLAMGSLAAQNVIDSINYYIDGKTQSDSLANHLKIYQGQEFATQKEMEDFVFFRVQEVINLHNTDEVTYYLTESGKEDGKTLYQLAIMVQDGWSLVPLAYPVLSNNSLAPNIFITDYNFMGTLSRATFYSFLDFRLVTNEDRPDKGSFGLGEWQVEADLYHFMFMGFTSYLELSQEFLEVETINEDGSYDQNYDKMVTSAELSMDWRINRDWTYTFGPKADFSYNFTRYPDTAAMCDSEVLLASYEHSLSWGILDWVGNFQKGVTLELSNSLGAAFFSNDVNKSDINFRPNFTLQGTWYTLPAERLNYNCRGWFYYGLNSQNIDIEEMRGVSSDECFGYSAAILNNGLNISLINTKTIEIQLEPFLDGGVFFSEEDFSQSDYVAKVSTGVELTLYVNKIRGFYIWSSAGVDLTNLGEDNMVNFTVFGSMIY